MMIMMIMIHDDDFYIDDEFWILELHYVLMIEQWWMDGSVFFHWSVRTILDFWLDWGCRHGCAGVGSTCCFAGLQDLNLLWSFSGCVCHCWSEMKDQKTVWACIPVVPFQPSCNGFRTWNWHNELKFNLDSDWDWDWKQFPAQTFVIDIAS